MNQKPITSGRSAWRIGAAVFAPYLTTALYLALTRWPSHRFTTFSDYAGLGFAVLVGAAFVATLPIRAVYRVLLILAYAPVMWSSLNKFSLWFLAIVFREGL
jgi:hypothetical protein